MVNVIVQASFAQSSAIVLDVFMSITHKKNDCDFNGKRLKNVKMLQ